MIFTINKKFKQLTLGAAIAFSSAGVLAADVSVTLTGPTGSAAAEVGTSILKNILYTPCVDQPAAVGLAATALTNATGAAATAVTTAATAVTTLASAEAAAAASATVADEAQSIGVGGASTASIAAALGVLAVTIVPPAVLVQATHIDPLVVQAGDDAATVVAAQDDLTAADAAVITTAADVVIAQETYDAAVSEIINVSGQSITNSYDQLKVNVSVSNDASESGTSYLYDLYFMIADLTSGTIFLFQRTDPNGIFTPLIVDQYGSAAGLDGSGNGKIFLPANQFTEASYSEDILGNKIYLDTFGLNQGTWMALAVLADTGFSMQDPTTWAAWDANVFVLGSPLATGVGTTGTGTCD